MTLNLMTGNPYAFQRFVRTIKDNGIKLGVYLIFFWRLAKWGADDARELLKRIGV